MYLEIFSLKAFYQFIYLDFPKLEKAAADGRLGDSGEGNKYQGRVFLVT